MTGVLLEMKDLDIASNFLVSRKLVPSTGEEATDVDADEDDQADDEFNQKQCTYLLKFVEQTAPGQSRDFYQRAFPAEHKVTHCSVSDSFVVYSVI